MTENSSMAAQEPPEDVQEYFLKLSKTFLHTEIVMVLLRAHLMIEQYLNMFIVARMPGLPEKWFTDTRYSLRVDLASALGAIPSSHTHAYRKINDLRNGIAHDFNRTLTAKDEMDLYNVLTKEQRFIGDAVVEPPSAGRFPQSLRDCLLAIVNEIAGTAMEARRPEEEKEDE